MYRVDAATSALYKTLLCAVAEHRLLFFDDAPRGALAAVFDTLRVGADVRSQLHSDFNVTDVCHK